MNSTLNISGTLSSDDGFYIIYLTDLSNKNYLMLVLAIIYLITLLCNLVLLAVVLMNTSLQNPKFLAVCNLAVIDISMSSVIIPQTIFVFVFNINYLTFGSCFSRMFFMHFFGDMESFSLALLAYDRLVAICLPLRYPTINTNRRMVLIIAGLWILVFLLELFPVFYASRLNFCSSRVVRSCCCEHGSIINIACGDKSFNKMLATAKSLFVLLGPLIFIICSYIIVVVTVLRIASVAQRWKAFHTCLTHLVLVLIYYLPIILAYVLSSLKLIQLADIFTAVLSVSVNMPPMLNPVIYSLKTEELRDKVIKFIMPSKVAAQLNK